MSCFVDQSICLELGLSNPNLKTCLSGDRSHPYRKDRWWLHYILWSSKSWREIVMTAWRLPGDTWELGQYWVICCLPCCFACLIYLFSFCDLFMASYFFIFEYLWCHFLFWLWIRVGHLSAHTYVYLHSISSIPELRPFRRKCWLCFHEIIISAMASQTLPEFMILITSWDNILCTVIRKCSHSNRTL